MANNVFGNPITDETLKGMPEYEGKQITKRARAEVAMLLKTAENKAVNAKTYVEQLKQEWGHGVSTLCLVYNATGDTIEFVGNQDWFGHIGPGPYPSEIANGQWGAFLHVKTYGTICGSNAAVVYHCKNESGQECDWVLAWDNPWNRICFDNKVYTEILEANQFINRWDTIKSNLTNTNGRNHQETSKGFKSIVEVGEFTFTTLDALLTLEPKSKSATLSLK